MSKNIFDGLSPIAGFASKLFANAGLDLTALMAAGNADALKLHLETIAKPVDLAAAITEATNKLQGDLTTATTELATAKSTIGVAQSKIDTLNAAFSEEALRQRQREHLDSIQRETERDWMPCMHDSCTECCGTGVRRSGGPCIHAISCPCPKCSPRY